MIDKDAARAIALAEINKASPYPVQPIDCVILDQHTIEKEYGWVFAYQARKALETGDLRDAVAGNGPVLVQKEDGHIIPFGTARPAEWYLAGYESGFRAGTGRLTITRVSDRELTLSCLADLRLTYVIPEYVSGIEWRIPKVFSTREFQELLNNLPAVWEEVGVLWNYETFLRMDASRCCDYKLDQGDWTHQSPTL